MRTYRILLCWLLPLICASFFVTLSPQFSRKVAQSVALSLTKMDNLLQAL